MSAKDHKYTDRNQTTVVISLENQFEIKKKSNRYFNLIEHILLSDLLNKFICK